MCGMQGTLCFLEKEPKPPVFTHNSLHTKVGTVPVQPCVSAQGPAFSKQPMWIQCQVRCKEIAELNILFTSTLLQCFSDCLLAGVITGCHSMLITALQGAIATTEQKQACLLLPNRRAVLYWSVQQRQTAVQIKLSSAVCNGRNG